MCLSIETAQQRKFCDHICSGWEGSANQALGWNLFLTVGQTRRKGPESATQTNQTKASSASIWHYLAIEKCGRGVTL